ncbi:hypothetical protein EMPS_04428 [Entomortierella parvispora]|uniref:FAD-binding domain-containing protein n=1 Tax=Entomortierella parvispora TaxID=205924 RepID=A0A9P3LVD9_9FUNG|nr:hypothetical protein EMPS_04428 [Entomortierella parvispora]
MNTGLQDSYNLSWKIALVLHGLAPKSILNTFEQERKPVAEGIIKLSATLLDNALAKDFLRRTLKRLMIAVGPYLLPYFPTTTNPLTMLMIRYHDNAINQRHKSQMNVDEEFQVGQRAREAYLEMIKKNTESGLLVGSTDDTVRLQELIVGPGIFHVMVFSSDMLVTAKPVPATIKGVDTTNSEFLAEDIAQKLLAWRTKWSYKSREEIIEETQTTPRPPTHHSQSVAPEAVSTASPSAIPSSTKASQMFMVHVLASEDVTTKEQSAKIERLARNQAGEGKIYLDQDGIAHQKYGVAKHGAGTLVVIRPDGHIGYRVLGIGHSAWEDVDEYFGALLA